MANVAKIGVQLTANANNFTAGMNAASKRIRSFKKDTSFINSSLGKFSIIAAGAGGAVTVLGAAFRAVSGVFRLFGRVIGAGMSALKHFGASVLETINNFDDLIKQGRAVGLLASEIGSLQLASEMSGASLENMSRAIGFMSKNIFMAASGSKEAIKSFSVLGVTMEQLNSKSPHDQFILIADAISQMDNATVRTGAAMQVFGRGAAAIANLLQGGGAGIRAAAKEAERLGLTVSEIDSSKIQAAQDAVTLLKYSFIGLKRAIAVQLAPYITGFFQTITDNAETLRNNFFAVVKDLAPKFLDVFEAMGNVGVTAFREIGLAAIATARAIKAVVMAAQAISRGIGNVFIEDLEKGARLRAQVETNAADKFAKVAARPRTIADPAYLKTVQGKEQEHRQKAAGFLQEADSLRLSRMEPAVDTGFAKDLDTILNASESFLNKLPDQSGGKAKAKFIELFGTPEDWNKMGLAAAMGIKPVTVGAESLEEALGESGANAEDLVKSLKKATNIGEFKQVQLALMARNDQSTDLRNSPAAKQSTESVLGARSDVRDPQLQQTNKLLGVIANNTRLSPVVG